MGNSKTGSAPQQTLKKGSDPRLRSEAFPDRQERILMRRRGSAGVYAAPKRLLCSRPVGFTGGFRLHGTPTVPTY